MSLKESDGGDDHSSDGDSFLEKLKHTCVEIVSLWFSGFKDACCLQRVYFFCRRSRKIFIKSCQCFILNGGVFLGSILLFRIVLMPVLQWLLVFPVKEGHMSTGTSGDLFITTIQNMLTGICYVFWLYPLYIISFVINCIWYNEIAQQAFAVAEERQSPPAKQTALEKTVRGSQHSRSGSSGGMESILLNIGEQIFSVIMLSIFFVEVFAASFIPYIGNLLNFILLSWLYAYYCFDYRWSFAQWSLEKRLLFFESNWAFFAGFGSPCVLATFFFSQFVSYGIMAILFPMFVLVATGSNPERITGANRNVLLRRIPVFYLSNMLMVILLRSLKGIGTYLLTRNQKVNKHS